jgi:hypothetical protein
VAAEQYFQQISLSVPVDAVALLVGTQHDPQFLYYAPVIDYNGQAQLGDRCGQSNRFGAVLAYRYMKSEYESSHQGEKLDAELTMSGPALGFADRF